MSLQPGALPPGEVNPLLVPAQLFSASKVQPGGQVPQQLTQSVAAVPPGLYPRLSKVNPPLNPVVAGIPLPSGTVVATSVQRPGPAPPLIVAPSATPLVVAAPSLIQPGGGSVIQPPLAVTQALQKMDNLINSPTVTQAQISAVVGEYQNAAGQLTPAEQRLYARAFVPKLQALVQQGRISQAAVDAFLGVPQAQVAQFLAASQAAAPATVPVTLQIPAGVSVKYTAAELEAKTLVELRAMCKNMDIPNCSVPKRKAELIDYLLRAQTTAAAVPTAIQPTIGSTAVTTWSQFARREYLEDQLRTDLVKQCRRFGIIPGCYGMKKRELVDAILNVSPSELKSTELTVAEMKEFCKSRGIERCYAMNRAALVSALGYPPEVSTAVPAPAPAAVAVPAVAGLTYELYGKTYTFNPALIDNYPVDALKAICLKVNPKGMEPKCPQTKDALIALIQAKMATVPFTSGVVAPSTGALAAMRAVPPAPGITPLVPPGMAPRAGTYAQYYGAFG